MKDIHVSLPTTPSVDMELLGRPNHGVEAGRHLSAQF